MEQALPLLHDARVTTIELFCEAPHLDVNGDWRASVRWLNDYARAHQLRYTLHAPCFDLNPAAANAGARAEQRRQYALAISVAEALEAPQIVVHSGQRSDPRLNAAAARVWTRALLEDLVPQAERAGVCLALENTGYGPAGIISSPEDLLEIIAPLPTAQVGLTLDVGHALLQQLDLSEAIRCWAPRLCNVHLHSNHGTSDDHLPPDQGVVALRAALDLLVQHGYSGYLVMEAFLGGAQPLTAAQAWASLAV